MPAPIGMRRRYFAELTCQKLTSFLQCKRDRKRPVAWIRLQEGLNPITIQKHPGCFLASGQVLGGCNPVRSVATTVRTRLFTRSPWVTNLRAFLLVTLTHCVTNPRSDPRSDSPDCTAVKSVALNTRCSLPVCQLHRQIKSRASRS